MSKTLVLAAVLAAFTGGALAQAVQSPAAASAPQKKAKKAKSRKPASSAVNPESSPFKQGGA